MSKVTPRPRPDQQPATTKRDRLRDQLDRAAAGRRAVGDEDAARLADAWAAELDGAA